MEKPNYVKQLSMIYGDYPLLISAFPGCGKTYLYEHQTEYGVHIIDSDSSKFTGDGWEERYVEHIQKEMQSLSDEADVYACEYIFISQHEKVLKLLEEKGLNEFLIKIIPTKECKKEYFDRYKNRNNDHIKDFSSWLSLLDKKWDEWTSEENMNIGNPKERYWLKDNEYLTDAIKNIVIENCKQNGYYKEEPIWIY